MRGDAGAPWEHGRHGRNGPFSRPPSRSVASVPSVFPAGADTTRAILIRTRAAPGPMLLGAHVSIAGGVEMAPPRAKELGCDVMQIFSKNQRQWKSSPLKRE